MGHNSQLIKKGNCSGCKVLCTAYCKDGRDLKDQVCAAQKYHLCTQVFTENSHFSPLYKISAYNGDAVITAGYFTGFFDLIGVSVMEWIIFSYNTGYLHLIFVSCPKSVYTEWRIHGTIIPTDRRFVQHALRSGHKIYTIASQLHQKQRVYCSHQKERERN